MCGITLGCLIGMMPLLFFPSDEKGIEGKKRFVEFVTPIINKTADNWIIQLIPPCTLFPEAQVFCNLISLICIIHIELCFFFDCDESFPICDKSCPKALFTGKYIHSSVDLVFFYNQINDIHVIFISHRKVKWSFKTGKHLNT